MPPERERVIGYGNIAQVMTTLEAALSRSTYLIGDSFTAADLQVGLQLGFGMMFGTIEKRPAFEHFWQRISDRPACARTKAMDDSLMPQPPQPKTAG